MKIKNIFITIISVFFLGCNNQNTESNIDLKQHSSETTDSTTTITNEEMNQLLIIQNDMSADDDIQKLAQVYSLESSIHDKQEIRDFIANYLLNKQKTIEANNTIEFEASFTIYQTTYSTKYTLILTSYSDNTVEIDKIEINRGGCESRHLIGKFTLNYGESLEYALRCNPTTIREITVYLTNGQSILLKPKA